MLRPPWRPRGPVPVVAPWPRLLQPHGERERLAVPGWDIPVHDVPHLIGIRPHGRTVTFVGRLCPRHGVRGPHHGEGVACVRDYDWS